ncbi:MAG: YicC/YloC family endoribonuclease [Acutalibacteraceae bacterium]|nr:YicC/YloC family endoribonuclease [Acutalibacteraceae bacterium]
MIEYSLQCDSCMLLKKVIIMITSMTGYGNSRQIIENTEISVEIRSVNHRYFELNCRTPKEMGFLEEKIRSVIKDKVFRGKIDIFVNIGSDENEQAVVTVNHSLVAGYINALKEVALKYGLSDDISVSSVARYNDIFKVTKPETDEEKLWQKVKIVLDDALDKFVAMRQAEGEKLYDDVNSRCKTILELVSKVEERSPQTVVEYRNKLTERMNEVLSTVTVDEQRVITEAAIFADKVAVAEETVRLRSHFEQFDKILNGEGSVGRKIDFILQEMNREANTIGSKVQDAQLAHIVVDIKAELEKIREQVQNIE